MPEPHESLAPHEIERIREVITRWAYGSEERIFLELLDGSEISTHDLGRAMQEREGRVYLHFLNLVAVSMRYDESLDAILADFEPPEPQMPVLLVEAPIH